MSSPVPVQNGVNLVRLGGTVTRDVLYDDRGENARMVINMKVELLRRDGQPYNTFYSDVIIWGPTATALHQAGVIRQGMYLLVDDGQMETRSWQDPQTGEKRYRTQVKFVDGQTHLFSDLLAPLSVGQEGYDTATGAPLADENAPLPPLEAAPSRSASERRAAAAFAPVDEELFGEGEKAATPATVIAAAKRASRVTKPAANAEIPQEDIPF